MRGRSVLPVAAVVRRAAATLAALLVLLVPSTARAHVLGLSRGEYTPDGATVHAVVIMRREDAALVGPNLVDALHVEADGAPCAGTLDGTEPDPPDGTRVRATYACPHPPSHLRLTFGFLDRLPGDHRHLATVHLARGDVDALAVLSRPSVDVDVGAAPSSGFVSLLRAGVEHILSGADHLAFLLALVLGGTLVRDRTMRVGSLVTMLTAFTVGHSGSLALATLGGFAPGARIVEPLVALSVAYVGAENLFTRSVRHRWMLTLPFGFVHGFAFAGGILPLGLPRSQLPLALLGFNLGVEAGQLLVLALILPPLLLLRSKAWYPRAARIASICIAVAGVVWFVQRVVS